MVRTERPVRILAADKWISDRSVGEQIALLEPLGNHQVSGSLAYVSKLQRSVIGDLMLYRKIPLIGNSWLHCAAPCQQGCTNKWITRRGRSIAECCFRVVCGSSCHVRSFNLRRSERRVLGEAKIGSSSFEIRRNIESSADDCLSAPSLRTPSETKPRLEVQQSVIGLIHAPAEPV